jgi:ATP-dependent DNA ligase
MATFPALFGKASTGKVKQWTIWVEEQSSGHGVIVVEHGYEGGKLQRNEKVISLGKNIGKKNETTPLQQAIQEARSQWIEKKEKGYEQRLSDGSGDEIESKEEGQGDEKEEKGRGVGIDSSAPEVMLAHDYHKRSKDIRFPCFVQPKLDGTRCVGVPLKGLFSRNRKPYPHLDHIRTELDRLPPQFVLDGELYSTELTFQEIVGLVKAKTLKAGDLEKQKKIQLHVYDLICPLTYDERRANLSILFRRCTFKHIVLVKTERCEDHKQMLEKHADYISQGYEGIMLRNQDGPYKGSRSADLQKYKEFLDKEYKIVGYQEGQGLEQGCVIWTCRTELGTTFACRPRGTREDRQRLFEEGDQYIGKWLTVRYQEETDDGLPRFPVGISFRDYE